MKVRNANCSVLSTKVKGCDSTPEGLPFILGFLKTLLHQRGDCPGADVRDVFGEKYFCSIDAIDTLDYSFKYLEGESKEFDIKLAARLSKKMEKNGGEKNKLSHIFIKASPV